MSTSDVERLPAALARRIALAAQGFADPRPAGAVGTRQLRRTIDRLAVVQIDSVNVLSRSHYLPAFSRLGAYPRSTLDAFAGRRHELFEYWAHEASLLPVRLHPFLRWRMDAVDREAWGSMTRIQRERPEFVAALVERIRKEGPLRAGQLEEVRPNRPGSMWNWHAGKAALEYLFFTGVLTARARTTSFERVYDLTERVLPPEVVHTPTPDRRDAMRELIRVAARALGVATEKDLRDYFRLGPADARTAIAELADAGELVPVEVAGWNRPAWLDPDARRPRWIRARALLSPFDSLVWERPRVERIFGFSYRLEIYTPAHKRVHGYYVLPFLLGDQLVGRVDLKADRQAGVLRVQSAHAEHGVERALVAGPLADELRLMAGWLELDEVDVADRGDLAPALSAVVRRVRAAGQPPVRRPRPPSPAAPADHRRPSAW